ncbi:SH3 domain-containing protein [Fulvivirga maritima]|uniref:SH3 domain-containing protein n=1 Tax=Fulvivirga maritima TaxID=2904247 RepID=UPI001F1B017E|nr:SH3 domain-containing protein [Fulvivirga maritima]UII27556.1 SH3 domain-containing protein [Fulvivirga maritima]
MNLRSGPGTSYKSVTIIPKGDTVECLSDTTQYWIHLRYKNIEGFSAIRYLKRLPIVDIKEPPKKERAANRAAIYILLIVGVIIIVIRRKKKI